MKSAMLRMPQLDYDVTIRQRFAGKKTYIRTYVHTYIRTYIHTYIRTYVHTYMYLHTHIFTMSVHSMNVLNS